MAVVRAPLRQWQGFYGDKDLLAQFPETLADIEQGRNAAHFERIHTPSGVVYSVRVNSHEGKHQADRLLFTEIQLDGKSFLFLISHIENHRYHRSTFLNNRQALKRLIAKQATIPFVDDVNQSTDTLNENQEFINDLKAIKNQSGHLHFHQQQIILFNEQQESILNVDKYPLLISGRAGSGKTAVLESLLSKLADESIRHDSTKKIVMIARSKKLTEKSKKDWEQSSLYDVAYKDRVLFFTDQMLLEYLAIPALANCQFVNEAEGISWLIAHLQEHHKKFQKLIALISGPNEKINYLAIARRLYQEFRIISGCFVLEEYLDLGDRQSLLNKENADERKCLWAIYAQYRDVLAAAKQVDPAFYQLEQSYFQIFYAVLVDEGLDLSLLQQLMLYSLAERLIISHDPHQRLFDELSMRPLFMSLLTQRYAAEPQLVTLPYSYRSSKAVLNFQKVLCLLENNLAGGIADNYDQAGIEGAPDDARMGGVHWYEKDNGHLSFDQLANLKALADSHECVFIINVGRDDEETKSKKSAIQFAYGARLILTVPEVKGLQYKYVVLCDLIDPLIFAKADANVDLENLRLYKNKAKKGQGSNQFSVDFNYLNVAISRAEEEIFVVHTPHHQTNNIARVFKNTGEILQKVFGMPLAENISPEITALPKASTEKEWHSEQERLAEEGVHIDLLSSAMPSIQRVAIASPSRAKTPNPVTSSSHTKVQAVMPKTNKKVSLVPLSGLEEKKAAWIQVLRAFSPEKFKTLLSAFNGLDRKIFMTEAMPTDQLSAMAILSLKASVGSIMKSLNKAKKMTAESRNITFGIFTLLPYVGQYLSSLIDSDTFSVWFKRYVLTENRLQLELQSASGKFFLNLDFEYIRQEIAISAFLMGILLKNKINGYAESFMKQFLEETEANCMTMMNHLLNTGYGISLLGLLLKYDNADFWKKVDDTLGAMPESFELFSNQVKQTGLSSTLFLFYAEFLEKKVDISFDSGLLSNLVDFSHQIMYPNNELAKYTVVTFLMMLVLSEKHALLEKIFKYIGSDQGKSIFILTMLSDLKSSLYSKEAGGKRGDFSGLVEYTNSMVGLKVVIDWLNGPMDLVKYRHIGSAIKSEYFSSKGKKSVVDNLMKTSEGRAVVQWIEALLEEKKNFDLGVDTSRFQLYGLFAPGLEQASSSSAILETSANIPK
ncbi:MAG: hypothetical protein WAW86_03520 [Gammaproteobacteria bacterium]